MLILTHSEEVANMYCIAGRGEKGVRKYKFFSEFADKLETKDKFHGKYFKKDNMGLRKPKPENRYLEFCCIEVYG